MSSPRPRVLVGLPVHLPSVRYLQCNLEYWTAERGSLADVVVVPNGDWPAESLEGLRCLAGRFPFAEVREDLIGRKHFGDWANLRAAQESLWDLALSRGYSHLLLHEVTRFPPPRALGHLLACDCPVIGAVYRDSYSPGAFSLLNYAGTPDVHVRPHTLIAWGKRPVRVDAIYFGFTLLRSDVLTRVRPRCGQYAADTYFCRDAKAAGIPIHAAPLVVRNVKVDGCPTALLFWWLAFFARVVRDLFRYRSRFLSVTTGEANACSD